VTVHPEEVSRESEQTLWQWLPDFFRHELAPYPGRWSLVARMVIAATLSMIVIVTFRIPYGAIGVNCAFILSRENLTATAKSGLYFILAFGAWAVLTPIGARMFAAIPITHFLWEGVTAFLCFFLLKTLTNFPLATGVVVVATATMAIWYLPGPAEINLELTLWQILATSIGALITFSVEVVFRYWSPQDPLLDGIDDRLCAIEDMLRDYSKGASITGSIVKSLTQYAVTGTGMLRQQIARNHSDALKRMKMNAMVSLLGRAVDVSAALVTSGGKL
jgi:multidrug resistance protein MdtO